MTHKLFLFLLIATVSIFLFEGCRDDKKYPIPTPQYAPVAVFTFSDKLQNSYFNALDLPNATFSFNLDKDGFGEKNTEVDKIDIKINYTPVGGVITPKPFTDDSVLFKAPGLPFLSFNTFPVAVDITAQSAASAFGKNATDLKVGDKFTIVFVVFTKDGRVFTYYAQNICNSPRQTGTCAYDILVVNPGAVVAAVTAAKSSYSKKAIATAEYAFSLKAKNYLPNVKLDSVRLDIDYMDSLKVSKPFVPLSTITTFPASISVKAADAAAKFGITATDLKVTDRFRIKFTHFTSDGKSFTNFGGGACSVNWPTNEVHPYNDPKIDAYNPTPPATPVAGTCNLTWSVIQ